MSKQPDVNNVIKALAQKNAQLEVDLAIANDIIEQFVKESEGEVIDGE